MLEIGHEEIAKRRSLFRIKCQMLPVLEAPACRNHRQVGVIVTRGISEILPGENRSLIQKGMPAFFHLIQLLHELRKELHLLQLDLCQLLDLLLILPVVTEIVPILIDPRECRNIVSTRATEGHEPG